MIAFLEICIKIIVDLLIIAYMAMVWVVALVGCIVSYTAKMHSGLFNPSTNIV